jgi:hypothetical protein
VILRNAGFRLQDYTTLEPTRRQSERTSTLTFQHRTGWHSRTFLPRIRDIVGSNIG